MTGSVPPAWDDIRIRSGADRNTHSMLVRKRASSYSLGPKPSNYWSHKGSTGVTKIDNQVPGQPGTLGMVWSYRTEPTADRSLREAGVWLWKHAPTYYQPLAQVAVQVEKQLETAPLIVLASKSGKTQPTIVFTGSHVLVQPHSPPWPDPRAHITHPDFLPSTRLAAYQACEVAGYRVWRHDRDSFICALRGCQKPISDFSLQARICVGCGPRSCIRYCCHEHEVQDFRVHWRACGSSALVAPFVIDHSTAPAYFSSLCPAIRAVGQHRSLELHRQRHFACHSRGQYTLFDTNGRKHLMLQWPREHPVWQEMESRIERLLNIGFLDSSRYNLLGYLYGILRHLLSLTTACDEPLLCRLKRQFTSEFGEEVLQEIDLRPIFPCECAWLGRQLPLSRHLANCESKSLPQDPTGEGFLGIISQLEAKYWILRAWRQQHPTVPDWRKRAEGEGFELGPNSSIIKLGPGFAGWGAEPCNSCG